MIFPQEWDGKPLGGKGGEVTNSSKQIRGVLWFMGVTIGIILIGCCAVKVSLSNYDSVFTEHYTIYKGKRIYHMNFDNQVNDTSICYYYNLGKNFSYSVNGTIHNYFCDAFRPVFTKAGMGVSNMDNLSLKAPVIWVTLFPITDASYLVKLIPSRRGELPSLLRNTPSRSQCLKKGTATFLPSKSRLQDDKPVNRGHKRIFRLPKSFDRVLRRDRNKAPSEVNTILQGFLIS